MNKIVLTRLYIDPDGFRELYMVNWYSAPELFVMLMTTYKILACGTTPTNMKGWDATLMNLFKSAKRGKSKTFYNPINRILFGQLKDNKVVLFVSTIPLVGSGTTMCQ